MRRHAESLLVLAGSPPLRTWSRPVPVADVLRAALSEINYDRVDIKELEPVEVRGASVSDLAHLLAELLENATAFSPPQTRVRVLGRTDADGYTIVVVDEGIGMSPQELATGNGLINSSEETAFLGDSRMLGLGVVGRLAARHGFRVSLTASPVGGVVAWVTLPTSALAPRHAGADNDQVSGGAAGLISQLAGEAAASSPSVAGIPPVTLEPSSGASTGAAAGAQRATNGQALPPSALPLRRAQVDEAEQARPTPTLGGAAAAAPESAPSAPGADSTDVAAEHTDDQAADRTGSIKLPPRAPEVSAATGAVRLPSGQAPGRGPTAGLPPQKTAGGPPTKKAAGDGSPLKRRIRGAQLPDTGESVPPAAAPPRADRTAQSVRGALQSFATGRRIAADETTRDPDATGGIPILPGGHAGPGAVPAPDDRSPLAPTPSATAQGAALAREDTPAGRGDRRRAAGFGPGRRRCRRQRGEPAPPGARCPDASDRPARGDRADVGTQCR